MRLAVRGAWVADNLRRLGQGAFYHLAYATHQVHPDVMERLRSGRPQQGRVGVYLVRDSRGIQIADGELVAIHWFPEFIRIHFMISKVFGEDLGEVISWGDIDHLLLP